MAAAARKARTAQDGPKKVDPTAPAPTPTDAVLRAKASRPTFRRAGLAARLDPTLTHRAGHTRSICSDRFA
jgi:hypothetical protein